MWFLLTLHVGPNNESGFRPSSHIIYWLGQSSRLLQQQGDESSKSSERERESSRHSRLWSCWKKWGTILQGLDDPDWRERERQNFRFGRSNFFFLDALSLLTILFLSLLVLCPRVFAVYVCVWLLLLLLLEAPRPDYLFIQVQVAWLGSEKAVGAKRANGFFSFFSIYSFFLLLSYISSMQSAKKRVLEEESESVPRVSSFPPPTMTLQHLIPGKSFEWPPPNGAR